MNELRELNTTFLNLNNSLSRYGINLPAIDLNQDDSFKFARNLEQDLLFQINTSLQSYNDLISEGPVPEESEESQTGRHLQKFLEKYKLSVSPKLLTNLTDDCIVEVYSRSHQQIYRSVNFFKMSSYDIGTLTFMPWDKLFFRSREDTEALLKVANFIIDNNMEYIKPNVPTHFLTEIITDRKFGYKLLSAGNVMDVDSGKPMGYFAVITVKEVIEAFKIVH